MAAVRESRPGSAGSTARRLGELLLGFLVIGTGEGATPIFDEPIGRGECVNPGAE